MLCLCSSSTPYSTSPGECQQHGGEGEEKGEETDRKERKNMWRKEWRQVEICLRDLTSRINDQTFVSVSEAESDREVRL